MSSRAGVPVDDALAPFVARLTTLEDVTGRVLVACSGGADSLALLALVRAAGFATTAVHVDHGLRPGDHDATVVAAAAMRFGADFRAARVDVATGGNLEARARAGRYAVLERVRAAVGADVITVGHTRDDQAETVLLNLLRGSAKSGLAGMPARRGFLRRPLLGLRRAETCEICARLRLAPVQDPMNDDLRYRRVWLRREVIPRLEQDARRDLVEVLARQAEVMRDDDTHLDALAATLVEPGGALRADALVRAPVAIARRAVRRWLGAPLPSLDHVDAVLAVARGDRRAAELSGGERIERAGGLLHRIPGVVAAVPADTGFEPPGVASFGAFEFDAWIEHAPPVAWPDGRRAAVLDADRAGDSFVIRAPRPGDRFRPLGRSGTKSVADALREAGVVAADRAGQPLVVGAAKKVCWVVGYRIDEHVKVTARTRRYLWISAESVPPIASARR